MSKEYRYKGFVFKQKDVIIDRSGRVVPLYEIDGLKKNTTRPFLTTVEECKEYIDEYYAINLCGEGDL